MSNPTFEDLQEMAALKFPAIFDDKIIYVKINRKSFDYEVIVDGACAAHVKYNNDLRIWLVAEVKLNDLGLLTKIGERIEARYN